MLLERHLVWQFNRGRTEAVRDLYELHKHDLVTLATALLIDKSEAEDVVHDVFVGFIQSAGTFRLTGSLKGYLATCVANRARNRNKSMKQHGADEAAVIEPAAPERERPDLTAMFGEEQQHLGGALARLPYEQREAIVLALNHSTSTAWAMEQAIQALQKYRAVHLTGYTTAGGGSTPIEVWARADATGTRSEACLARSASFTAWVRDDKTYTYDPASRTVYVEPDITIGLNPWFGPKFLKTLSRMHDYQAFEGDDPATGQRRVLVTGSIESAIGPQSFLIEFDARTKLPVSLKRWLNLERRGAPDFYFDRIVYFEDLPDSALRFDPPPGVRFTPKPLTVPEGNLAMLSDPKSGLAADGLTREGACRKLLEQFWTACIDDDFGRIHQLCPVTAAWPDDLLRDLGAQEKVVELLKIGGIEQEGQSRLGPLALVPSRVRCQDGKVRVMRLVVQFRHTEQGTSCVVHGPLGYSVEAE
jgi:RNA polymerase sigma factor (sigma-70 family)